jgi:hypothetical protein
MNLCCGELDLDNDQIERELEEVWVRQRYRCLESKKPRKVLMDQQQAEEEQLLTMNHRRGFLKGKNNKNEKNDKNNKNIRGVSTERNRDHGRRSEQRTSPHVGVRSSSAPKSRPWVAVATDHHPNSEGRKSVQPPNHSRGRSAPVQNQRSASKERSVQHGVSRSWSLDSRRDGDIRTRSNSRPRENVSPRKVHPSSSLDNRRRGMNAQVTNTDHRGMNALPPRPQLNVLQKRRGENSNNRHTNNYVMARQEKQINGDRNGHYKDMEESRHRVAANRRRQYMDYRDDSSSEGSSSEQSNVGMGLFDSLW